MTASATSGGGLCAVLLAAGEGTRLRPLTALRPKALCPVDGVPLLDRAMARVAELGLSGPEQVAVNACHLAEQLVAHVGSRATLSVEKPPALGTAGGVANLRDWIAGRAVLAVNADAYLAGADPVPLLDGWTGERMRLLVVADEQHGDYGNLRFAGMSLLPWRYVERLEPEPSELYVPWRAAYRRGELELREYPGVFIDCGTPADYLAANLHASGGRNVIGAGATVLGTVTRGVVWPGGHVGPDEHLVDAIRAGHDVTVPAGTG